MSKLYKSPRGLFRYAMDVFPTYSSRPFTKSLIASQVFTGEGGQNGRPLYPLFSEQGVTKYPFIGSLDRILDALLIVTNRITYRLFYTLFLKVFICQNNSFKLIKSAQ